MHRRNFLQALAAAAAGLTAAGRAAAQAPAPTLPPAKTTAATPCVAVTADTAKFERSLDEAQRTVIEMLKDCRVTNVSRSTRVDGFDSWTITYCHAPDAKHTSLDAEAARASAGRAPRSVTVTPVASSLDIAMMDNFGYYETFSVDKGDYEIEVEWV